MVFVVELSGEGIKPKPSHMNPENRPVERIVVTRGVNGFPSGTSVYYKT